jgi:hypothetical protein
MPFLDLIKKAIFEEEPQTEQPAKSAPSPVAGRAPQLAPAPSYVSMTGRDNQFYTRLAKQTDLSAVPELAKIEQYAAPLATVITEKSLRYKAALATASARRSDKGCDLAGLRYSAERPGLVGKNV